MNAPFYEISKAIPGLDEYYGILSGFPFSLALSIAGLFAGVAVDKGNRAAIMSLACIGWSLSSLFTGSSVTSLYGIALARFMLGATQSAFDPSRFSLI
jgi:MFS family permease